MGVFGQVAGGLARARSQADQMEEQRHQREIQQLALMASLQEQDIVPQSDMETMRGELPDVSQVRGTMPKRAPTQVDTGIVDPSRYRKLGQMGGEQYYKDRSRQIASDRAAAEKAKLEEALRRSEIGKNEAQALKDSRSDTGASDPLMVVMEGGRRVYRPRSQAAGQTAPSQEEGLVQVVDDAGNTVFLPKSQAIGMAPGNRTGGADRRKRLEALSNVSKALDAFESNLSSTGSVVMPSVAKDQLQTDYENLQLQLKELFNLGVLNGPDLQLMRRIVGDPTSLQGRLKAAGSAGAQQTRSLAQVAKMREKIEGFRQSLEAASSAPTPHGITSDRPSGRHLSAEDAAAAAHDPGFAAYLRKQGYEVP